MKAFCSWSGGKDCCLSLYKVLKKDIEVKYLLNMVSENGKDSRSHGLSARLLKLQAKAMGIPMVQRKTTRKSYETEFKKVLSEFKKKNIRIGIFGDIDLQVHRDWVEKVCKETGITPVLPLWEIKRKKLIAEFINAGFETVVVSTDKNFLGKEWLGRLVDKNFVTDLETLGNIDLCGEKGEYHTFVYDGPIFKNPVEYSFGKKQMQGKRWFLEILPE